MSLARKFRKKPVEIEAMRLDMGIHTGGQGSNYRDVMRWVSGDTNLPSPDSDAWLALPAIPDGDQLIIATLEGDMRADHGDYIIKGVKGEFYPCKPDIFDATYEDAS